LTKVTTSHREVWRPDEGDDEAVGRSSDLTKVTMKPEEGLVT
jgi:hypothetical protein